RHRGGDSNTGAGYWPRQCDVSAGAGQRSTWWCTSAYEESACEGGRVYVAAGADSANAANGYCKDGYSGPYCAVCADGFVSTGLYECQQCSASSTAGAYTALLIAFLAAAAAALYVLPNYEVNGHRGALAAWGSLPQLSRPRPSCCSKLRFRFLRIPIIVVQLVSGFMSISGLELAEPFQSFMMRLSILPSFSVVFGCIYDASFYTRLLFMTLAPLVPIAFLGCSWLFACARVGQLRRANAHAAAQCARSDALRRHWTAFLAWTFLIFGTVSSTIFQAFACDELPELGQWRLRADYAVQCYVDGYWGYFGYAMAMLVVYPIGITALYAYLLYLKRQSDRKLDVLAPVEAATGLRSTSNSAQPAGAAIAMYAGAQPNSATDLSVRSIQGSAAAQLSLRSATALGERQSAAVSQSPPGIVGASSFVWDQYHSKAQAWELVECARRLMLTGFLVFIHPQSAGQAAASTVFAFGFLLLYALYKPHHDRTLGHQYILGALIVYFASLSALLLKVDASADEGSQLVMGIVLVMLTVALIGAALLQILFEVVDISKMVPNVPYCERGAAATVNGFAARSAEAYKRARYVGHFDAGRWVVVPFVQESFGRLGGAARAVIARLATHAAARVGGSERVVRRRRSVVRRHFVGALSAAHARELAERIRAYVRSAQMSGRAVRPVSLLLAAAR
ncbi:hypothetical protein JKP88DRAFT_255721, partial [Tribonema minus]